MVKSGSMVTGCPDRPEHRMQISHRDATLRPNLSPKLHARQPKLVYSELFRASLDPDTRSPAGDLVSALNWFNTTQKRKADALIAFNQELLGGQTEAELVAGIQWRNTGLFKFGPVADGT